MNWFLTDGSTAARLCRTLVEVILSWGLVNIGDIFSLFTISPEVKTMLVGVMTTVLTAIIGYFNPNKDDSVDAKK